MVFSSAPDATEQCGGWAVWDRHLHAEFTEDSQELMLDAIDGWNAEPEVIHE